MAFFSQSRFAVTVAFTAYACTASRPADAPGVSQLPSAAFLDGSADAILPVAATAATLPIELRSRVVLVAGGDVDMSRVRGQVLLRDPEADGLDALAEILETADLSFANLESMIVDRGSETQSSWSVLVFSAPPAAAPALARAHLDLVSLANNHAWDYGEAGLFETFEHLDRAGVPWVGAGRTREAAQAPVVLTKNGQRIAFVAATGIWNQAVDPHPGKDKVFDARAADLYAAISAARALPSIDRVIVSYHGGDEYVDRPLPGTRALLRGAIDAGADAVIGHHPHVVQRVEIYGGRPIFYSLGNMLMRAANAEPWTEYGMLARLSIPAEPSDPISAEICPLRTFGLDAIPLGKDPLRKVTEPYFRVRFERLLRDGAKEEPASAVSLDAFGADGCAEVR